MSLKQWSVHRARSGSNAHSVIRVERPFGEAGVRRPQLRPGSGVGYPEEDPQRRHDDAGVADRHHRLVGVIGGEAVERSPHPLVEAVPALARRGEHAVGLGLHVEVPVRHVVLGPRETVGVARVHLAQVEVLARDVQPDARADDLGGLDRPRQHARDHHVGADPLRVRQVVSQRLGLAPPDVGEPGASPDAADHPVKACVSVAVADQDQSHLPE